ncbi:hypothetical protein OIDMADRAFT_111057 [Oidiodendron maius Zn]|uniref:HNH nuclease domain-containing protein n=1 Tax=Oidiodendron maius (strain Zn) TaxID=913774 RepID=A0A0C3HIH7_OIDMZ|nr:hypothetical protein OIDMADRAFT_111057 [Oidiodendron maius Zn]
MSSPSSPLTPPDVALADVESESQFGDWVDDRTALNTVLEGYPPGDDTASFLRTFFHYLPEREGQHNLAIDVHDTAQVGNLRQLRNHLEQALLQAMRAKGGKTPATITPSPRPAAEAATEELASHHVQAATRDNQSGLKERCQKRDGHRCVVTGGWHPEHAPTGALSGSLEAAHIIPLALGSFKNDVELQGLNIIWEAIYRYFPSIRSRLHLELEDVNREENVITMYAPLHHEFGIFKFILEQTETRDRYRIKTFKNFSLFLAPFLPGDGFVTLRSHDGRYLLPDPSLLALHAAIGNILHATGSAERIDKILRDLEGASGGLAPDGTTDISALLSMNQLSLESSRDSLQKPKPAAPPLPGGENQKPMWS